MTLSLSLMKTSSLPPEAPPREELPNLDTSNSTIRAAFAPIDGMHFRGQLVHHEVSTSVLEEILLGDASGFR